jgi:hypothetical protein
LLIAIAAGIGCTGWGCTQNQPTTTRTAAESRPYYRTGSNIPLPPVPTSDQDTAAAQQNLDNAQHQIGNSAQATGGHF